MLTTGLWNLIVISVASVWALAGNPQQSAPIAKADHSPKRLELIFSSTGGQVNTQDGETQIPSQVPDIYSNGETMSAEQVFKLAGPEARSDDRKALFRDANVSFEILSPTGDLHIVEPLGRCGQLDFFSDPIEIFSERAVCDDRMFSYALSNGKILVSADGVEVFSYSLNSGRYILNGIPVLVQ